MPHKAPLTTEQQSIYPALDSLEDAVAHAKQQLPITDPNTLIAVLMTYHNTLLRAVSR